MNFKVKNMIGISILVFAIVPALALFFLAISRYADYQNFNTTSGMNAISKSNTVGINEFISDYLDEAVVLTELNVTKETAKSGEDSASTVYKNYIANKPEVLDIVLVKEDGGVIVSTSDISKANGIFSEFTDDIRESDSFVSNISFGGHYGESVFVIGKSFSIDNEKFYVCNVVSAQAMLDYLAKISFGTGGQLAMADANGNIINLNGEIVQNENISESGLKEKISQLSTNEQNGDQTFNVVKAGKYKISHSKLRDFSNWASFTLSDDDGNFVINSIINNSVVVVIFVAICLVIGLLILGSILNPMTKMLKTMTAIKEDKDGKNIRFDLKTRNDFGGIADSFNNLLDEVILSADRHKTIANISDSILFEWDFTKESMYVSENFHDRFDVAVKSATLSNGRFIDSLMNQDYAEVYKKDINTLFKSKNAFSNEYQVTHKNGKEIWISVRVQCVTNRLGELLRIIGVITDIDNEKRMELELSERASYDFLSQLYNRNTFERELQEELERRSHNKLMIFFIDLDDFKFINDRFGHSVGDDVIKHAADVIKSKVDERTGFAGRFGGDEFVLCFSDKKDIARGEEIAQEIIDSLYEGYMTGNGMLINVKCSVGIAICPEHGEDSNELLRNADAAMYFVKKNGKSNYHVFEESDKESSDSFYTGF